MSSNSKLQTSTMENTSAPLHSSAPASASASDLRTFSDKELTAIAGIRHKRYYLRCCGCVAALVVVAVAILVVILILTVFKARAPIFRINKLAVEKLELINGTSTPRPGSNATINADVSVENRNLVSFRHPNTTSMVYYRGAAIGEVLSPAGTERARRTRRSNVTMIIMVDRVLSQPDLGSDLKSGRITVSLYTRVGGRAKIFIVKKHATLKMKCTATINVTSLAIEQQECKLKFKL